MNTSLVDAGLTIAGGLLFPATCVICGNSARPISDAAFDLCSDCTNDLPENEHACILCAEPLPSSVPKDSVCGQCLRKPPRYHRAFCAYRYTYPIDHLLRAFKFHGRVAYGRVLGELLAGALKRTRVDGWPQLVVPVPLATQRFNERGFNQAIELGRVVEARLGIPLRADIVARVRSTREQTGLDRAARRKNLRGAFAVAPSFSAKHVAILDDVITTGSTMNELARVLRRAGAKRIEVWAVARTAR
jgi:ComF family protein